MNIKLISIILIILSSVFLGCVEEKPTGTLTPTPTITATVEPTALPTYTPTPTPIPPLRKPLVYKSFVDQDYGFRRVIETNYTPFVYENVTLYIYVGDIVIWINDADPDERLTIISEQNLWSNTSAILRWNRQQFNYRFNQPGTYSVYIKEYPRIKHQKITVNP